MEHAEYIHENHRKGNLIGEPLMGKPFTFRFYLLYFDAFFVELLQQQCEFSWASITSSVPVNC